MFRVSAFSPLQGKFLQTCQIAGNWYGVAREALENVAREGLAAVFHMDLEATIFRSFLSINESLNTLTVAARLCLFLVSNLKLSLITRKLIYEKQEGSN